MNLVMLVCGMFIDNIPNISDFNSNHGSSRYGLRC